MIEVNLDRSLATQDAPAQNPIMALISRAATDPSFDVAKLEHLLQVKVQWEREEARKVFVTALTAFKADPPDIYKNKKVDFDTQKGKTSYKHASLDHVSIAIGTALSKHGLSHRWNVEQKDNLIKVTAVLMHNAGHSESLSMTAAADQSGSKNSIQALGSAVTYLERYTLLALTGMAVQDDDDGKGAAPAAAPIPPPTEDVITEGENNVKITGVFKLKDTFKVQGEIPYFTKEQVFADAAKKMYKANEEAKIKWKRDAKGIYWIVDLGRTSETF